MLLLLSPKHPNYCDCLLHALVGHALQSANCTQEATATFLLLPDWLGWSKNGYMSRINNYPEHACVLAKFPANSMLLNPTEVWLNAPPQPQHNKNKMQLIVAWNNENKPLFNPTQLGSTISSRQFLKQRGLSVSLPTCLTLLVWNARISRKKFQLLHPDTSIAADISQWQILHNTNVNQYKSLHIPKIQNWRSITYTDGSAKQDETSKQQTKAKSPQPQALAINPGGNDPTLTINRAELADLLVAVQKGNTGIATDSAPSLFQTRKQLLNPMAVVHHLHRELLKGIVNLIQSSPSTIT
jgi:hypothetical protein